MKTSKQLGSGQEIVEMFEFNRRWIAFVVFSAVLTTLCLAFGVLNIVGSLKVKETAISFAASECPGGVCAKTVSLDFVGKSYVYVDYDFLLTSYFIYAKGTSYNDVFKRTSYSTNTDDCYPVATFNDYKRVLGLLNLQVTNPKVLAGLQVNGGNNKISPCGLKAALFDHIGSLSVANAVTGEAFPLAQRDIIHDRYYKLITSDQSDFVDVTSGRFFAWYMPQMPAFGTKIFHGIAEKDLRGSFTFTFDQTNVFYDKRERPSIHVVQLGPGIWRHFSNLAFGVFMLCLAAIAVATVSIYLYLRKRHADLFNTAGPAPAASIRAK